MGSLVCALASYLDARHNRGRWLVRIEDIDPPREPAGAAAAILSCLEAHQLLWDGEVLYQSSRSEAYRASLATIADLGLAYYCTCTRKRLAELGMHYDGHCRTTICPPDEPASIKFNLEKAAQKLGYRLDSIELNDRIQGRQRLPLASEGDFVIHRKDQLFAYQLAVVVDDMAQGISDIVRGIDLFESVSKQICLTRILGGSAIRYAHIPVLVDKEGRKLSKQNHAEAVSIAKPQANLFLALRYLQQDPPAELAHESLQTQLDWGIRHWNINKLQQLREIKQC